MKTNFFDANNAKFRRKIIPGETLEVKATLTDFKRGLAKGYAEGFVDKEFACSAEFVITVPDIFDKFIPKIVIALLLKKAPLGNKGKNVVKIKIILPI